MPLAANLAATFFLGRRYSGFAWAAAAVLTCITARLRRTIGAKRAAPLCITKLLPGKHLSHHSEQLKKNMLSVSPHFRANHPAFAAHRAPPPGAAAAADDDADYVLALAPEWAAKLKPTIERLRARDGGGGRKKQPRRKKAKNKRPAPAPAPAADLEALAAAAQEYAAARSNDDDDAAEPTTARTVSAPPDESAAEPTLQESLETRRDQLLAWLSLS